MGLGLPLFPTGSQAAMPSFSSLVGEWRIADTEFVEPAGVQAYSTEQLRALVGNRLLISKKRTRWIVSHGHELLREHDWLADQCRAPRFESESQSRFSLHCENNEEFGPNAAFSTLPNGDLRLTWWDGVILKLHKIK